MQFCLMYAICVILITLAAKGLDAGRSNRYISDVAPSLVQTAKSVQDALSEARAEVFEEAAAFMSPVTNSSSSKFASREGSNATAKAAEEASVAMMAATALSADKKAGSSSVANVSVEVGNLTATAKPTSVPADNLPMSQFVDAVTTAKPTTPEQPAMSSEWAGGNHLPETIEHMRFAIVRIQSVVQQVDWFRPFQPGRDEELVGSGFAVDLGDILSGEASAPDAETEEHKSSLLGRKATAEAIFEGRGDDDPLFLTNAHVVRNARDVKVQLPAVGATFYEAYVPMIFDDFDLAIVRLKDPARFRRALAATNASLQTLSVAQQTVNLGLEVTAVGFPLGSSSLKLSRGVISGTEEVDGAVCFQSTAPISPGSSGGPLFALGGGLSGLKVVGVNFASSSMSNAQNTNFVIPTVHIMQILHGYRSGRMRQKVGDSNASTADSDVGTSKVSADTSGKIKKGQTNDHSKREAMATPQAKAGIEPVNELVDAENLKSFEPTPLPHDQMRVAPIDVIGLEANDALYNTSNGCKFGVYLSRIYEDSVLRFAKPPVQERSFLMKVNDVTLDSFGMGRSDSFLGDPLPFESLMGLEEKIDDSVTLEVCRQGQKTTHLIETMGWRPEYDRGIKQVLEPHFHPETLDFESFAGVTVMQMSVNHILELLKDGPVTLGRWMLPENQIEPRLLVTHVTRGTYASRVLSPGMVVTMVNHKNVSTLAELRNSFEPEDHTEIWVLETDRGVVFASNFLEALAMQLANAAASPSSRYLLTPSVLKAAKRLRLLDDVSEGSDESDAASSFLSTSGINEKMVSFATNISAVSKGVGYEAEEAAAFAVAAAHIAKQAEAKAIELYLASLSGKKKSRKHAAQKVMATTEANMTETTQVSAAQVKPRQRVRANLLAHHVGLV